MRVRRRRYRDAELRSQRQQDDATRPGSVGRGLEESGNASVAEPRTPEDVAAALFEQLGTGPRLYSHPDDAASASHAATLPQEAVARMGRLTELFWK